MCVCTMHPSLFNTNVPIPLSTHTLKNTSPAGQPIDDSVPFASRHPSSLWELVDVLCCTAKEDVNWFLICVKSSSASLLAVSRMVEVEPMVVVVALSSEADSDHVFCLMR